MEKKNKSQSWRTTVVWGVGFLAVLAAAVVWEFVLEQPVREWVYRQTEAVGFGEHVLAIVVFASLATAALGGTAAVLTRRADARIETERKLVELRQRLDAISASPDWIWEIDENDRYSFASPKVADLIGYAPDEILGKTPFDLAPPDEAARLKALFAPIKATRQSFTRMENVVLHRNGAEKVMESNGMPFFDPDGTFRGYRGVDRDITEYKALQKAITESEERLRAVFENTPICLNLKDTQGRYLLLNKPYEDWLAQSAENIVGRTPDEFLAPSPEIDREITNLQAAERQVLETGVANERVVHVDRNGEVFHRILIKFPVKSSNGTVNAIGTAAIDITERVRAEEALRKSEAQLRGILDSSPVSIQLKDLDGRLKAVNQAFLDRLGLTMEQAIGARTEDFVPEDIAEKIRAQDRMVLESGAMMTFDSHHEFLKSGGPELTVVRFPVKGDNGEIEGIGTLSFDVSDRRTLERQLMHAQKMEAVGQLTGGVAHDFNNLLQIMLANLELARSRVEPDPEAAALVDRAIAAGRRGANLTRQLLVFSRNHTWRPENIDIAELLDSTVAMLKRTLGENIVIETAVAAPLPPIRIDPNGLENALLNLALNARAAMPKGGTLTIRAKDRELTGPPTSANGMPGSGTFVEIALTDNGIGMPPEIQERVFEPFFTTKDIGEGSGLGLSMVYGFVQQSGGRTELESRPGEGTTVRLLLPVAEACAPKDATVSHKTAVAAAPHDGTILVVEDDPDVRASTALMLISLGYDVVEADDAAAALAILDSQKGIDLLFTDVMMPHGMNGFELADAAVQRVPRLRALLTSGYPEAELRKTGTDEHRFELLTKPYSRDTLTETLNLIFES